MFLLFQILINLTEKLIFKAGTLVKFFFNKTYINSIIQHPRQLSPHARLNRHKIHLWIKIKIEINVKTAQQIRALQGIHRAASCLAIKKTNPVLRNWTLEQMLCSSLTKVLIWKFQYINHKQAQYSLKVKFLTHKACE